MKVLLTNPAFLHADLCFDSHFCKSIVFYWEMNVFFLSHFCDASETRINQRTNVYKIDIVPLL